MADNDTNKMATCPVCGYQETATDAAALQTAMEEHMQTVHNMSMPDMNANADIKVTGKDTDQVDKLADAAVSRTATGFSGLANRANQ